MGAVGDPVIETGGSGSLATDEDETGHPVTPAKQLCVGSEHSSRDPPGHGSHTDLALNADTPHYKEQMINENHRV